MRVSIVCVALIATLLAVTASAQCSAAGSLCRQESDKMAAGSVCDVPHFLAELGTTSNKKDVYQMYQACTSAGTSDSAGNRCCPDPCLEHSGTVECAENRNCAALPLHSNGQSQGVPSTCIRRDKLCGLLTVGSGPGSNSNPCGYYSFCYNNGGVCAYQNPTSGSTGAATLAPGDDVSAKCGELHPMVVAMLALMFVTLVGGIILVGVVVVINQKKADQEEAAKDGRR